MLVFISLSAFAPFFVRADVQVKGQPPSVLLGLLGLFISLTFWFLYSKTRRPEKWESIFLISLLVMFGTRMVIVIHRGDSFNHLVWLMPIAAVMLLLKPPTRREITFALQIFALSLGVLLALALVTQWLGALKPFPVPEHLIAYQRKHYWLPLDGLFNIQGRWTGPLGHDTRTGFAAALMTVIAAGTWSRLSKWIFVLGVFFLLAASVRASYLATMMGVGLVLLFGRRSVLNKVPLLVRWLMVVTPVVLLMGFFASRGSRFSGRDNIWPAFLDLFQDYPVLGASQSVMSQTGGIVATSGDAHNIFVDELARYGVVGSLAFLSFVFCGVTLSVVAANKGFPLPAAIFATYFIAAATDRQGDWLQLSYHVLPVILAGLAAAITVEKDSRKMDSEHRSASTPST